MKNLSDSSFDLALTDPLHHVTCHPVPYRSPLPLYIQLPRRLTELLHNALVLEADTVTIRQITRHTLPPNRTPGCEHSEIILSVSLETNRPLSFECLTDTNESAWSEDLCQRSDSDSPGFLTLCDEAFIVRFLDRQTPGKSWGAILDPSHFTDRMTLPIHGIRPDPRAAQTRCSKPKTLETLIGVPSPGPEHLEGLVRDTCAHWTDLTILFVPPGPDAEPHPVPSTPFGEESVRSHDLPTHGIRLHVFCSAEPPHLRAPDFCHRGYCLPIGISSFESIRAQTGQHFHVTAETIPSEALRPRDPRPRMPLFQRTYRNHAVSSAGRPPSLRMAHQLASGLVYKAMRQMPAVRPTTVQYNHAMEQFIELPAPAKRLARWTLPKIQEFEEQYPYPPDSEVSLPANALLVPRTLGPEDCAMLYRAAQQNGLLPRLFRTPHPQPPWLADIPSITAVLPCLKDGDNFEPLDQWSQPLAVATPERANLALAPRAEGLRLLVCLTGPEGPLPLLFLDTDFAFHRGRYPFLAEKTDLDVNGLTALLQLCTRRPDETKNCDALETHEQQTMKNVLHLARRMICGEHHAAHLRIQDALQEISIHMPPRFRVHATVSRGSVDVQPDPLPPVSSSAS